MGWPNPLGQIARRAGAHLLPVDSPRGYAGTLGAKLCPISHRTPTGRHRGGQLSAPTKPMPFPLALIRAHRGLGQSLGQEASSCRTGAGQAAAPPTQVGNPFGRLRAGLCYRERQTDGGDRCPRPTGDQHCDRVNAFRGGRVPPLKALGSGTEAPEPNSRFFPLPNGRDVVGAFSDGPPLRREGFGSKLPKHHAVRGLQGRARNRSQALARAAPPII